MKILFTGGGTGGHLMPIIAIGRELQRLHPAEDLKLQYAGPKDDLNLFLLKQEGFKTHAIARQSIKISTERAASEECTFKRIPFQFAIPNQRLSRISWRPIHDVRI